MCTCLGSFYVLVWVLRQVKVYLFALRHKREIRILVYLFSMLLAVVVLSAVIAGLSGLRI